MWTQRVEGVKKCLNCVDVLYGSLPVVLAIGVVVVVDGGGGPVGDGDVGAYVVAHA